MVNDEYLKFFCSDETADPDADVDSADGEDEEDEDEEDDDEGDEPEDDTEPVSDK